MNISQYNTIKTIRQGTDSTFSITMTRINFNEFNVTCNDNKETDYSGMDCLMTNRQVELLIKDYKNSIIKFSERKWNDHSILYLSFKHLITNYINH